MIYQEVEELVQSEEGLNQLLTKYAESFALLEKYAKYLVSGKLTHDSVNTILARSTGLYDVLNAVYIGIDTYKTNKEGELFTRLRLEFEKKEKPPKTEKKTAPKSDSKFNVSAVKEEISGMVGPERRVRDWFKAYAEMAERNISSAQSWLNHYEETFKNTNLKRGEIKND